MPSGRSAGRYVAEHQPDLSEEVRTFLSELRARSRDEAHLKTWKTSSIVTFLTRIVRCKGVDGFRHYWRTLPRSPCRRSNAAQPPDSPQTPGSQVLLQ